MTNKNPEELVRAEAELLPCPFCGKIPHHTETDVEPQGDPWYRSKIVKFILCKCGATLFDESFHEGFSDKESAAKAWNTRTLQRAEQEKDAVEFAEWIAKNGWQATAYNKWRIIGTLQIATTAELYQKFLTDKK